MSAVDGSNLGLNSNGEDNLATSILAYSLTLGRGLHFVALSGVGYSGNDLPNMNYAYSTALINVRHQAMSLNVILFGMSTMVPLAVNSYNGNKWLGWDQYATK